MGQGNGYQLKSGFPIFTGCWKNYGPALFLASNASNYVYGHVLVVDGWTTASVQ
ncbi:hypothetical protein [Bacillus sp. UNC41MFS5]|uniref:hypothetical protein n=1 Tax=Bacillus sp. UNC41MFS5 TaxID=1449046 RepID=UPI000B2BF158|nr:hypothetical protein [Bacillus sp. UNC41MFS5]